MKDALTFVGVNYYGKSSRSQLPGAARTRERSDTGLVLDPAGLYTALRALHERYTRDGASSIERLVLTEFGVADRADALRPAVIVEHLLALPASWLKLPSAWLAKAPRRPARCLLRGRSSAPESTP